MSRASIEAGQRWLVAGGFAEPCTYGQLVQEVIRDNAELSGHTTPGGVGYVRRGAGRRLRWESRNSRAKVSQD